MSEQFWQRLNYIFGLIALGVVFGLTAFTASLEVKDLDLWLHLKTGKYITENLYVPAQDIFSCMIGGSPWNNHEWLFQVIIYNIWNVWGFDGLINMQIWVVLVTFLMLVFLSYSKHRQLLSAFFLLLLLVVYQTRFTIRPDIYSLMFFVAYMGVMSWFIDRRWSLWALMIIQVLWTNMHGFFFFGPLLVLVAIGSEFIKRRIPLPYEWNQTGRLKDDEYKRLKIFFPFILLACCINPLTFKGAWYPLGILLGLGGGETKVFFDHITELQKPITWATIWAPQYGAYKLVILLSGISLILNRRKIDISTVLIWVIFLIFSLMAVRNMVFFATAAYLVMMANVLTINWKEVIPFRFSNERFKYMTSLIFKFILIFWVVDNGTKLATNGYFDFNTYERKSEFWGVSQRSFPHKAVDFLVKNKIKGNFFNDFNSGAYLIGRTYPNIKVFIDGRTELYGSTFFKHYQKLWRDGNKELFLKDVATYNLTGIFLNNNNQQLPSKILKMVYQLPGWKMVYFDHDGIIFLKDVPANKAWIKQFEIDLKTWKPRPMDLQKIGSKQIEPLPITKRAYLLITLGLDDLVLREAHEAIKVSPDDYDAHKFIAEVYRNKKDYRKSFEYYRIATILRPYDLDNRLNFAGSYIHLKDYAGAIEQFERAIELDPRNVKAHFGMAKTWAMRGHEKKALEYLTLAQKLDPEDKVDVKKIRDIIDKNKNAKMASPTSKTVEVKGLVKPKQGNEPVRKKN